MYTALKNVTKAEYDYNDLLFEREKLYMSQEDKAKKHERIVLLATKRKTPIELTVGVFLLLFV
jgi:hypothetical protein